MCCTKKTGHALVYCFSSGSTYEKPQVYLTLYSNFCAPTILTYSSDSWCCCFCAQNVFSWGINLHRKRFFKGTVCCFHPLNTFNGTETKKKDILKGSSKIELLLLLFIFRIGDRPRKTRPQHTVPCFSSWHPFAGKSITAMLQLATKS